MTAHYGHTPRVPRPPPLPGETARIPDHLPGLRPLFAALDDARESVGLPRFTPKPRAWCNDCAQEHRLDMPSSCRPERVAHVKLARSAFTPAADERTWLQVATGSVEP